MTTTIKRTSLALTKEDIRIIETLCKHYGETQTDVIKRAIVFLEFMLSSKPEYTRASSEVGLDI
jgi:hypothetical protein